MLLICENEEEKKVVKHFCYTKENCTGCIFEKGTCPIIYNTLTAKEFVNRTFGKKP